jgi:hypothetical protein
MVNLQRKHTHVKIIPFPMDILINSGNRMKTVVGMRWEENISNYLRISGLKTFFPHII